jgi:deazaflavin-dependent oxidoreductase (nitroreductase family)
MRPVQVGRTASLEEVPIMTESHSLGRYRAPGFVTAFNPLVRRMIRAGLPLGPNVTLTVRGRSSGLPRTFPVAVMETDGRRFIQSPYGEVNWVRNLRANPKALIAKGSRDESVEAIEVAPEDAVAILRAGVDRYLRSPFLRPVVRLFTGVRRDSTDEEMLVHARRHPMFELRSTDSV